MKKAWVWGGLTGAALAWLGGTVMAQTPPPPPPAPGAAPAASPTPVASPAPAATTPAPGVVARVNGTDIPLADLEAILKAGGPSPLHLNEAQRKQRQFEVLSLMIDNLLMHQYLEKNTPPVQPQEVNKRIAEMETGLQAQGKSLAEFCHDTNQTLDQLKAGIADHIRWANFAATKVNDAAVDAYYRENKDFFDGVTVRASHIVLRLPATTPEAERQKARETLMALRAEIVAGKIDFAEAARKHSQDPRAKEGGDLGFFPRKWVFDEPFAKAAFSLPVNAVSEVVATDYGYHLIKVTDRKAGGQAQEYAKIKEGVREFCLEDMRQGILNELRKSGDIKISLP